MPEAASVARRHNERDKLPAQTLFAVSQRVGEALKLCSSQVRTGEVPLVRVMARVR